MKKYTSHNPNSESKTIIYNNNKIEILPKPFIGKETIIYNNTPVPSVGFFGSFTNVFIAVEEECFVQYDIKIALRWHFLGYYITVKRQKKIIYSNK